MAPAAPGEVAERPAWRVSFRRLIGIAFALTLLAVAAGSYVYRRYGGYRPLALAHVPQTMRYRARVETSDQQRLAAIAPLLGALDPRGVRRPLLEQKLGLAVGKSVREVAFGVGAEPADFVLVFGLQLQAETGLPPARILCETLQHDGVQSHPSGSGCQLEDGAIVAGTEEGAIVIASRADLVDGLLGTPDLGDRLGFSGPSVRGVAPQVGELGREAAGLAARLRSRYP